MAAEMDVIWDLGSRILDTPARAWGDLFPLAEVCFWAHWPGVDPQGADADAQMRGGPFSAGDLCNKTLAKVLEAIFTLAPPARTPGGYYAVAGYPLRDGPRAALGDDED